MIRPCWITTEGEIIDCPNPMDHIHKIADRFPTVVLDLERYVEKLGWIKITGYSMPPRVYAERQPTQRQIDAMFRHAGKYYDELSKAVHEFLD